MKESVKGGKVWSPEPEKSVTTRWQDFVDSSLFFPACMTLSIILTAALAVPTLTSVIHSEAAYQARTEVTKNKLVSQCDFTNTEADKFFTKKNGLKSIQGVTIEGKATVVKLQLKDSKAEVSDFLTKETVCSFTIPKLP